MLILTLLFTASCKRAEVEPTPVSPTKTPKPTFTPRPVAQALPTHTAKPTATAVPPTATPTATAVPPTATATLTIEPTEVPTEEPTVAPTAKPTVKVAAVAAAKPAASSAGAVAAQPKGSPLAYQPEFVGPSPASGPADYGDHVNPLSGVHVDDPATINRRPILVRYGNDHAARPHSGVSQAEIVMEDLMDAWWITRLTAVYLENAPTKVGPIRSARPVNIEILPAFDGVLVFSGASIGVSQLLAQESLDLIHEGQEGDLFYRGADRAAPHNLYTSIEAVHERLSLRGKERGYDLRGFTFAEATPSGGTAATQVHIPLPKTSTVDWSWDVAAGVYRRWVQGVAYTDHLTGEQVGCENVIIIYAKHWESDIVEDSRGATSIGIALRGGERVQIFRDGQVLDGFWWRSEKGMLFQFIDGNGNDIPLKPGHSWIQFVPTTYKLGIQ